MSRVEFSAQKQTYCLWQPRRYIQDDLKNDDVIVFGWRWPCLGSVSRVRTAGGRQREVRDSQRRQTVNSCGLRILIKTLGSIWDERSAFFPFFYSKLYFSLNHQTWLLYAVDLFVENTHFASHIVTSVIFVGCSLFQLSRDICGIRCQKGHVSCRTSRHIQQSLRGIKYDSDRPHSKPVVSWFEWLPRFHFFHPSVLFRLSWSGSRGPEPIAAVWGREAGSSLDRAPVCHRGVTQTTIHAHIQTCGQFRVSNEPKATNWCLCGRKAEDPGRTHAAVLPCRHVLDFIHRNYFRSLLKALCVFNLLAFINALKEYDASYSVRLQRLI